MISSSSSYKNQLNTNALSPKSKIIVNGIEYLGNIIKDAPKIKHSSSKIFGTFPSKTVSFTIYDIENNIDFEDQEIEVYKGIVVDNSIEYLKQGIFIPNKENIKTNISDRTISFSDVQDRTQLLEERYTSSLDWSSNQTHTGLEIIQEICTRKNITLKSNNFAFANYAFKQPNFSETITDRGVIAAMAEIGGEVAIFDSNGQLEIKGQNNINHIIQRKKYEKVSYEKQMIINTIVLGKDGINDDIVYPEIIETERVEAKILDNPFVDLYREEMIEEVANHIIGLTYIPFQLDGFVDGYMYELNDEITILDKNGNSFEAVILELENTSRIKSKISAPVLDNKKTDYSLAGSNKKNINEIRLDVDHINDNIRALTTTTQEITDEIGNVYTKQQTNELIQTSTTGITNTFSESGGNNIFRNTGLWFSVKEQSSNLFPSQNLYPSTTLYPNYGEYSYDKTIYEFWEGIVEKIKEEKASNLSAMLLMLGDVYQEQKVPNGNYTISFKYKKLISLANVSVKINGIEYAVNETEDTEFVETIVVNSQYINILFSSDKPSSCEIYDLMVNAGNVKLAYSQNQNETTTDTVNISKGITIESSNTNTKFKADSDGVRIYDKNSSSNDPVTKFIDTGMETNEAVIKGKSQVVGTLWQEVGEQTWITRL